MLGCRTAVMAVALIVACAAAATGGGARVSRGVARAGGGVAGRRVAMPAWTATARLRGGGPGSSCADDGDFGRDASGAADGEAGESDEDMAGGDWADSVLDEETLRALEKPFSEHELEHMMQSIAPENDTIKWVSASGAATPPPCVLPASARRGRCNALVVHCAAGARARPELTRHSRCPAESRPPRRTRRRSGRRARRWRLRPVLWAWTWTRYALRAVARRERPP